MQACGLQALLKLATEPNQKQSVPRSCKGCWHLWLLLSLAIAGQTSLLLLGREFPLNCSVLLVLGITPGTSSTLLTLRCRVLDPNTSLSWRLGPTLWNPRAQ